MYTPVYCGSFPVSVLFIHRRRLKLGYRKSNVAGSECVISEKNTEVKCNTFGQIDVDPWSRDVNRRM